MGYYFFPPVNWGCFFFVAVLRECMRVVRKGGLCLIYAWAQEQERDGVSRHQFESQDVLVAWHHKVAGGKKKDWNEEKMKEMEKGIEHGKVDAEKSAIIYQRYCHVYVEGELEGIFRERLEDIAVVKEVYMDTGNWCVVAERI